MRLYLASRSPRRRELLHQMGVEFNTLVFRDGERADVATDETPRPGEAPLAYVERVARAKAGHGLKVIQERRLPPRPVLIRRYHARVRRRHHRQAGQHGRGHRHPAPPLRQCPPRAHRVLTGVAVSEDWRTEYVVSVSEVRFRKLDDDEIRRQVLSGEPMDKAGAYGIQGRAGMFVEHLAGSFTGVMGLPVCETGELLKRFGWRF